MLNFKKVRFHNPKSLEEIVAMKKFYSKVKISKDKLLKKESVDISNHVNVAKAFNDSHTYHVMFSKELESFKNIEKPSFDDLRNLINNTKKIVNRAKNIGGKINA